MKISTKGRYALRMLVDLYEHRDEGYISLKDISDRQNVSKKYLENIVSYFTNSDILLTARGARGGYALGRDANQISVGEVLTLTEGDLAAVSCLMENAEVCTRVSECKTLPIWQGLSQAIISYLNSYTVEDVAESRVPNPPQAQ